MLSEYYEFLEDVAKQLAYIQANSGVYNQWPTNARNMNKVLGENWIVSSVNLLLDENTRMLEKSKEHTNLLSFLFYSLLEKDVLLRNFNKKEIRKAGVTLFSELGEVREGPSCKKGLITHKSVPKICEYENTYSQQEWHELITLLELLSEISSPVYRLLSYEFHGPYNKLFFRNYFINLNPLVNSKMEVVLVEKIVSTPRLDFFAHLIKPEEIDYFSILVNGKEKPIKLVKSILISNLKKMEKKFEKMNKEEQIYKAGRLLAWKIREDYNFDIKLDKNIVLRKVQETKLTLDQWEKIIIDKTIKHLK